MRRTLWWTLSGAVALSALSLALPRKEEGIEVSLPKTSSPVEEPRRALTRAGQTTASKPSPTESLPSVVLERALRDPFEKIVVPVQVGSALAPPPIASAPRLPSAPPAMPYKVMGVLFDPDGNRVVFLGKSDKFLVATPGMRLDEGFLVEAVAEEAVHLLYPATDTRFSLQIPQIPPA